MATDGAFRVTGREQLFDSSPHGDYTSYRRYDVSVDDQQFLMLRFFSGREGQADLMVVENWFQELERTLEGPGSQAPGSEPAPWRAIPLGAIICLRLVGEEAWRVIGRNIWPRVEE